MTRKQVSWLFLAIAVAGLLAAGAWFIFRPHQEGSGPADQTQSEFITVEAFYPGADAQVVADTVAAPIEQKINGVEGMLDMVSCSTNDGTYTLQIGFQPGTDLNVAQVMVQNRVDLAMPKLPEVVKMKGMTVKKRQPGVLAIVTLTAQDNRYSEAYLSNYANKEIRDELAHVEGVGDVVCIGPHGDGAERDGFAMLNGVPAVALVLWPLRAGHAKEVSAGIEQSLATLRKKLPEGITMEMSFDFAPLLDAAKETTAADYLIVDVQLPDAASLERTREVLRRCDDLLRKTDGVKDVLSLSDNPFSLSRVRSCLVVRLTGDDKPVASIRDRLHQEMAEAAIQIRDLSGPRRFPYCACPSIWPCTTRKIADMRNCKKRRMIWPSRWGRTRSSRMRRPSSELRCRWSSWGRGATSRGRGTLCASICILWRRLPPTSRPAFLSMRLAPSANDWRTIRFPTAIAWVGCRGKPLAA